MHCIHDFRMELQRLVAEILGCISTMHHEHEMACLQTDAMVDGSSVGSIARIRDPRGCLCSPYWILRPR
jgi:hypothetical protein